MIRLDGVRRQFGARILFDNLCWSIPAGARIGLVGPNGAGKTTLLRILAGREQPDGGLVHRPQRLQVGYLPQEVEAVGGKTVLSMALEGFEEVSRLETQLLELARKMSDLAPGDPAIDMLAAQYGELRDRFEALDGDRLEARAKAILTGLGVSESSFPRPPGTLSGGWRMRVVLARLLLGVPGLLLLDEPTNHLDLEAIDWLEQFLDAYEGSFVVVSHDRYFLNRMVRQVMELERGALTGYSGNYDDYLEVRTQKAAALEKAAKQQARELAKVERFIQRFRYKNTKARQVQSRLRALEKIERVETTRDSKSIRFGFPPAPRSGDIVFRVEQVTQRYGDHVVYDGLNLLLERGDRLALIGPNGAGKSTLLKILAGRVVPEAGSVEAGHNVLVHYYAQHQLDALDPDSTVLEELERVAPPEDRPRLRSLAGRFLFAGEDVDKRVAILSGGEKARLALAKMLTRAANLLLLDEPTNHLDLRSREVLEDALNEYDGTLVLISHDRYFINRVATGIAAVGQGTIERFDGDYDAFVEWSQARRRERSEDRPADPAQESVGSRRLRQQERREAAEERNRRYRERRAAEARLAPLEDEVAALEQRLRELESAQADPQVYSDPDRAREVGREKGEVEQHLQRLYVEWERLADEPAGS